MSLSEIEGMKVIMPRVDRSLLVQILVVDGSLTDGGVERSEAQGYDVVRQTITGLHHGYNELLPHICGNV